MNNAQDTISNPRRPGWQDARGPRYGNQRKQVADLKVRARRNERASNKKQAKNFIREELNERFD
jgi:hypothetical protein